MEQVDFKQVPEGTREALAERARVQMVERYGLHTAIFDQAERLVMAGQVALTGKREGMVYDQSGWAIVTSKECGHCLPAFAGVCRHRVAIAFADLLARYAPAAGSGSDNGEAQVVGVTGLGGGRYTARSRWRRRKRGNGQNHCPRCGGFLDAGGGCNKCGGGG